MAFMSMVSQSSLCLQMPQNTNQSKFCNTDHIYLFTSFHVQDSSICSAAYCFVLAFCVQIWPTSFKAQLERLFSYRISLALAYYFFMSCHVKICCKKSGLLAYIVFVVSWDVYFSQTEVLMLKFKFVRMRIY